MDVTGGTFEVGMAVVFVLLYGGLPVIYVTIVREIVAIIVAIRNPDIEPDVIAERILGLVRLWP